ncbi:MAG TPA: AAA family ATPase, partial [Rhizomicrobium sp.]|nr:AAA family ATPase [Rhizomicrobium sp.]
MTEQQELDAGMTPDMEVDVKSAFGIDSKMKVKGFKTRTSYVPDHDNAYRFDRETTLAILAGFAFNRRVMIQGYHGTGKSTHIEQVASRLNWPCIRINLDSHISRIDLIGKDAIVLKDGKQVTEFREGLLPWCLQHPVALVFDEYDAGRPDVMFVIQRVLEVQGKLTLLDQNKVIRPHGAFRLFSTTNTIGLGDTTGLYHGTQQINLIACVEHIRVAAPAPPRRSPKEANFRRFHPRSRHPVIILAVPRPISGRPDVSVTRADRLLVDGQLRRGKSHRYSHSYLREGRYRRCQNYQHRGHRKEQGRNEHGFTHCRYASSCLVIH